MACMVRAWRARRGSPPGAELALGVAARLRRWAPVAARLQTEAAPGARARGGRVRASAAERGSESARSRSSPGARARERGCGDSTGPRLGLGSLRGAAPPPRWWSGGEARTQARYGVGWGECGRRGDGREERNARVGMAAKETRAIPDQRGAYSRNFLETRNLLAKACGSTDAKLAA